MLPKKKRVDKNTFETIWGKGSIVHGSFFVFKYIKALSPRYSFSVSKKLIKKANKRNYFRRIGYNILRENLDLKPLNGVFVYKKEGLIANKNDLSDDINSIFNKIR